MEEKLLGVGSTPLVTEELKKYRNTQKTLGAKFYEISDSINFFDNKIN